MEIKQWIKDHKEGIKFGATLAIGGAITIGLGKMMWNNIKETEALINSEDELIDNIQYEEESN